MSQYAIEVNNLSKQFGKFKAVNGISFSVEKGEIFGFLGANGAGKSTTIRMLCGILMPTSGTALVGGYDINTQTESVKNVIGYMSQKFSLYEDLTVEENINFFGGVYGLNAEKIQKRLRWTLEMAGLKGREKSLTKTLAGGWKQRLALGCAILHEPKILFLDEPTSGVDPVSRRKFWELINLLSEQGVTVLVTTHYLEEAEYCNSIILINAGEIIALGSPKNLKDQYIKNPILELEVSDPAKALEILSGRDEISEISMFGIYLHAAVEDEDGGKSFIGKILSESKIGLRRIERITPSMEDVFLYLLDKDKRRKPE